MERRDFIKKTVLATGGVLLADSAIKSVAAMDIDDESSATSKPNKDKMKIVVLTGSPRKNGNSAYLAEQFIKGAQEEGHEVFRFDCAFQKVEGCMACNQCGMDGPCILNDDFEIVRPHIIAADMVVFATPMYYFGVSAQLKKVIDRFYAINGQIKGYRKKAAFLMTYANTSPKDAEPMLVHYRTLVDYLGWEDAGTVVAPGVWTAGSIRSTDYGTKAYQLGRNLK